MTSVLIRDRRRGGGDVKTETRVMQPQAKDAWSPQQLELTRKDPPLEPSNRV